MSDGMSEFRFENPDVRRKIFWLLKRLTSYSLWEKKRNAWSIFTHAYEEAVKAWPEDDPERMSADGLSRIYRMLSLYNDGLADLKKGNRSVWLEYGALTRAVREYYAVSAYIYPHPDYWERGIQEAPYPPKVEALNKLMRSSEFLGDAAPFEISNTIDETPLIASPGWLLDPKAYKYRFYALPYPMFPESLAEVPEPTSTIVASGRRIPIDGVWEPVSIHRNRLLGVLPVGEAEIENSGCFNYFVRGARAPKVTGAFDEVADRFRAADTHWRLVWEDARYKGGIIPDESEYFIEPAPPEVLDDSPVNDVRTHDICSASGLWGPVGYKNPPIHIAAGTVMPDLSVRDAKGEMIIHYVTWRLVKRG